MLMTFGKAGGIGNAGKSQPRSGLNNYKLFSYSTRSGLKASL